MGKIPSAVGPILASDNQSMFNLLDTKLLLLKIVHSMTILNN